MTATLSNFISNENAFFEPGCQVICAPHAASGQLLSFCAKTAVKSRVRILDFGNRCDMYFTARQLRYLTRDPAAAIQNILLQRAFTCYQALGLLTQLDPSEKNIPVIILDLLAPFLDENVQTGEVYRLFNESIAQLNSLMHSRMLLIGVKPVPQRLTPDRVGLLNGLTKKFGMITLTEANTECRPELGPAQPTLFEIIERQN